MPQTFVRIGNNENQTLVRSTKEAVEIHYRIRPEEYWHIKEEHNKRRNREMNFWINNEERILE